MCNRQRETSAGFALVMRSVQWMKLAEIDGCQWEKAENSE